MSKFYNNVKSRLTKQGYTGFVKSDYLEAAKYLGITDLENPTTEQIKAGVDYLVNKQSSQISTEVIQDSTSELVKDNFENSVSEIEDKTNNNEIQGKSAMNTESALSVQNEAQVNIPANTTQNKPIVQHILESAPSELREELIIEYANNQLSSAAEVLQIKQAIDEKVRNFLAVQMAKSNEENTNFYSGVINDYKEQALTEATKRSERFQSLLSNFDSRLSEFKLN
jgi:hypothetical protein